jgi:hypothetical protein
MRIDSVNSRTFQSRAFVFGREWDSLSVLGKSYLGYTRTATDMPTRLRWVGDAGRSVVASSPFDSMAGLTATPIRKYGSPGDYLAGQRYTRAAERNRCRRHRPCTWIADSGLAVAHWQSLKPMDRPYLAMLSYLASVRDVKRGAEMAPRPSLAYAAGIQAPRFTEGACRPRRAGTGGPAMLARHCGFFRLADVRDCEPCFFLVMRRRCWVSQIPRVWFERYATASAPWNAPGDAVELAHTYRRLGELYEDRGDEEQPSRGTSDSPRCGPHQTRQRCRHRPRRSRSHRQTEQRDC